MKSTTTIAGLSIALKFCKKVNDEPIHSIFASPEPLVTIYDNQNVNAYTVNIAVHVPENLEPLNDANLAGGLFLTENKDLYLSYNGVRNVDTSVFKFEDGILLCRDFAVEYDSKEQLVENYDLYYIQFDYKLLPLHFQSVEAIIVKLVNEDPETDRGTVTTVRKDKD